MDSLRGIVFLWPVHPSRPTAAAVRLLAFERAARRLSIPTTVIIPMRPDDPAEDENAHVVRISLYDTFTAAHGFLAAIAWFPLSTLRLAKSIRASGCGVVVSSTPGVFVGLQGLAAAKLLDLPFVFDIRDSWEIEKYTHAGRLRNWVKERLEQLCARSAARVLCVTATVAEHVRVRYAVPTDAVDVVPNGADLALFSPQSGPKLVDFVFAGSPATYRNVPGVVESLARVRTARPATRAIFLGWDRTPQTPEIRRTVAEHGLESAVELTPAIPHSEVPGFLARARLGIVSLSGDASFRGAVGAKTYEYIACGVPVACLADPGDSELRRLVEEKDLGFFATSPEEFARQSIRVLGDDALWSRLSANCVRTSTLYDRRAIAEKAMREDVLPLLTASKTTAG